MDEHDDDTAQRIAEGDAKLRAAEGLFMGGEIWRRCAYCNRELPPFEQTRFSFRQSAGKLTIGRYCCAECGDRDNFEFDDSEPYVRPEA